MIRKVLYDVASQSFGNVLRNESVKGPTQLVAPTRFDHFFVEMLAPF